MDQILGEVAVEEVGELSRPVRQVLESMLSDRADERPMNAGDVADRARHLLPTFIGTSLGALARSEFGDAPPLDDSMRLPLITEGLEQAPTEAFQAPNEPDVSAVFAAPELFEDEDEPTEPTMDRATLFPGVGAAASRLKLSSVVPFAPVQTENTGDWTEAEDADDPTEESDSTPEMSAALEPMGPMEPMEPTDLEDLTDPRELTDSPEPTDSQEPTDSAPVEPSVEAPGSSEDPPKPPSESDALGPAEEAELDAESLGHRIRGVPEREVALENVEGRLVPSNAFREVWPEAPDMLLLSTGQIDVDSQVVVDEWGERIPLVPNHARVLAYLASRSGQEIGIDELFYSALKGRQGTSPESIRGLVARLRDKLEEDPEQPLHLLDGEDGGYLAVGIEPARRGPTPLPEPDGPLYGRDLEQRELDDLLEMDDTILVSVVGPPGSGASQLALRAAWRAQGAGFEVHRALVGKDKFLPGLARSLQIRSENRPHSEVLREVGLRMVDRQDLLVFLDSPRPHPALRGIVSGWLDMHVRSIILVAGRSPLGLPGEKVVRLGPLGRREAISLFQRRVADFRPGTEVSEELASSIAEYLDRMPVALEAAAAQTAFVPPEDLLDRLGSGMDLDLGDLPGGLEANLADSIEQLDAVDQEALRQLVAFRGGFDLSAAEAVVVLPPRERRSVASVLEALEARSMVQSFRGTEDMVRWGLYETVRSYLRRTMPASELEEIAERHGRHYGLLGLRLGAGPWVERRERASLHREAENLRAVLKRGGAEAAGAAVGMTAILGKESASNLTEGVERLQTDPALAQKNFSESELDPVMLRKLFAASRVAGARLQLHLGQAQKARTGLREAASELTAGDVRLLVDVAWMHTELGSTFGSESALHRVTTTDPWVLSVVALLEGRALFAKGTVKESERTMVRALHGFREIQAAVGAAHTQQHMAEVLMSRGKAKRAITQLNQARKGFEDAEDVLSALRCRIRLAELLVGLGQVDEAAEHLRHVLTEAQAASAQGMVAFARGLLAGIYTMQQDHDEAENLFFLALGGASAERPRIQGLFALSQVLLNDPDTALEEAKEAIPDPVARAIVALLERQPPPQEHDEAFLVFDALEAWRAGAPLDRVHDDVRERSSLALRMVLAAPYPEGAELR